MSQTTVVDLEVVAKGNKTYTEYLVDLRKETDIDIVRNRLISHCDETLRLLKQKSSRKVEEFYVGKTYIKRKKYPQGRGLEMFDPMDPNTWDKSGISKRWGIHKKEHYGKNGMIVLTAITKEALLHRHQGNKESLPHQEQYTLALEQMLQHHYKLKENDPRFVNNTFTSGGCDGGNSFAYAVYIAFRLSDEHYPEEETPGGDQEPTERSTSNGEIETSTSIRQQEKEQLSTHPPTSNGSLISNKRSQTESHPPGTKILRISQDSSTIGHTNNTRFTNGSTQQPPQEASRRKSDIVNPNTYKEQMLPTMEVIEEHPSTNQQAISSAEKVQYQQRKISDYFIHSTQAQQWKDLTSYRQTTNPTSSQNSLLQSPVVQKVLRSVVNATLENIRQTPDPLQSPLTSQSRGSSFQENLMSNPYKQPVSDIKQGHTPFNVASTSTSTTTTTRKRKCPSKTKNNKTTTTTKQNTLATNSGIPTAGASKRRKQNYKSSDGSATPNITNLQLPKSQSVTENYTCTPQSTTSISQNVANNSHLLPTLSPQTTSNQQALFPHQPAKYLFINPDMTHRNL